MAVRPSLRIPRKHNSSLTDADET